MNTSDMTGRKLDAAVAVEVMGLKLIQATPENPVCTLDHWSGDVTDEWSLAVDLGSESRRGRPMATAIPGYSKYPGYAMEVEEEIEKKGLVKEYMLLLTDRLWTDHMPHGMEWAIRRATPEQICRAALAAVRGTK